MPFKPTVDTTAVVAKYLRLYEQFTPELTDDCNTEQQLAFAFWSNILSHVTRKALFPKNDTLVASQGVRSLYRLIREILICALTVAVSSMVDYDKYGKGVLLVGSVLLIMDVLCSTIWFTSDSVAAAQNKLRGTYCEARHLWHNNPSPNRDLALSFDIIPLQQYYQYVLEKFIYYITHSVNTVYTPRRYTIIGGSVQLAQLVVLGADLGVVYGILSHVKPPEFQFNAVDWSGNNTGDKIALERSVLADSMNAIRMCMKFVPVKVNLAAARTAIDKIIHSKWSAFVDDIYYGIHKHQLMTRFLETGQLDTELLDTVRLPRDIIQEILSFSDHVLKYSIIKRSALLEFTAIDAMSREAPVARLRG